MTTYIINGVVVDDETYIAYLEKTIQEFITPFRKKQGFFASWYSPHDYLADFAQEVENDLKTNGERKKEKGTYIAYLEEALQEFLTPFRKNRGFWGSWHSPQDYLAGFAREVENNLKANKEKGL